VSPEAAGIHFNKIACFCFTEQTLAAGESVEMPVTFYVDPALAGDRDARSIGTIVLSYTFSPFTDVKPATAAKKEAPEGQPKGT
jgi:cytochrome c oxidase assembly protein subunit 11